MHDAGRRDDVALRIMRVLERNPRASQRDIATNVQVSLGAVNHCLRALQQKGLVKVRNFRAADNKLRYAYILTPKGMAAKLVLTQSFLARKLEEYARLQAEIDAVRAELANGTPAEETERE